MRGHGNGEDVSVGLQAKFAREVEGEERTCYSGARRRVTVLKL
jgi:hypothetical protein